MATPEAEVPDSVTYREVQEVLCSFADSDWTSLTLEVRGMRITVGKNGPPTAAALTATAPTATPIDTQNAAAVDIAPLPATGTASSRPGSARTTAAEPPGASASPRAGSPGGADPGSGASALDTTGLVEVRSPAVGAFWAAPSPGEAPFVAVGQVVGLHDQLAIVEVMKLMNPVTAPVAGEIVHVLAADAEMVEYEQVLFLIRPTDG